MEDAVIGVACGAMGSLLATLGDLLTDKYQLVRGAKGEIMFLKAELQSMHAFLKMMSEKEKPNVQDKCWANEVRELSYDIEDSVNEFKLRAQRNSNNEPHGFMRFIDRIMNLLTTIHTQYEVAKEFQGLKRRVLEVRDRCKRYRVDDDVSESIETTVVDRNLLAINADRAGLVGIEQPRDEMIRLMDEEDVPAHQLKKPNLRKILRTILSQIGFQNPKNTNLEAWDEQELLSALQKFLLDKRYFIVIDDIWDASAWDIIRCALPEKRNGSKVITTTRVETVARACCSNHSEYVYKMKKLSDQDSRKLFFKRIFGSEDACPTYLKEVLAEILKKCGGLPLAIITTSSFLATQPSKLKAQCLYIRNSMVSDLEVNPSLEEDCTIDKHDLARQWAAEGFVSKTQRADPEDVAKSYFNELINRSLIQPIDTDYNGDVKSCRVHDMMLDLILHKSREENFMAVIYNIEDMARQRDMIRRLPLNLGWCNR